MISEYDLRAELKRYPRFIKRAIRDKDWHSVAELVTQAETIEWILDGDE
jgi:hypothetical protein